ARAGARAAHGRGAGEGDAAPRADPARQGGRAGTRDGLDVRRGSRRILAPADRRCGCAGGPPTAGTGAETERTQGVTARRSRAIPVEDGPDHVDAIVLALERRGMLPSGKSSLGVETPRCDRMEIEFMDRTVTTTDGGSSSADRKAVRRSSRFRRRQ